MTSTEVSHHGLTIWTTAVFVIGEIAGGGVLALPKACEDTGWIGIVLLVVFTLVSAYTGTLIGKTWIIIQNRFPEYSQHVPDPYPVIGEMAYGKVGRHLVSFAINFTLFGASTVYIILASENIEDLMSDVTKDISFCYWLLILGGILTPITCIGTPKDFWPIGVGATFSTGIACVLILIQVLHDKTDIPTAKHSNTEIMKFSAAFGTIVFSVSGHPAFPTFLADMKKKSDFKWAIIVGYISILQLAVGCGYVSVDEGLYATFVLLMYLPTATSGFFVYGSRLNPNILKNMSAGPITYTVEILLTLHLIFAFLILINPVCQELEAKVGVPKWFTWKRCVARTLIVMSVLFVAETVPHFGAILSLVGGSTTTLLSYILPCLFYLKMCKKGNRPISVKDRYPKIIYQATSTDNNEHVRVLESNVTDTTPLINEINATERRIEISEGDKKMDKESYQSNSLQQSNIDHFQEISIPFWERVLNYQIIFVGTIAGLAATVSAISDLVTPDTFSLPCYLHPIRQ